MPGWCWLPRWAPWHPPSVHLTKVLEAVAKEQKSARFAKARPPERIRTDHMNGSDPEGPDITRCSYTTIQSYSKENGYLVFLSLVLSFVVLRHPLTDFCKRMFSIFSPCTADWLWVRFSTDLIIHNIYIYIYNKSYNIYYQVISSMSKYVGLEGQCGSLCVSGEFHGS